MSAAVLVTEQALRSWPLPEPVSEKHGRGVTLVVGGSESTPGAVRLAGEAALRAGSGQLKIATVRSTAAALGVAVPEARVYACESEVSGDLAARSAASIAEIAAEADATLIGCGFVDPDCAEVFVAALLPRLQGGAVMLDALASAYVGRHRDELGSCRGRLVLTMNPSELAHVLSCDSERVERDPEGCVAQLVAEVDAVVLLGGETKVIGDPDGGTWVVTDGGPGLAISGSGDVQAGMAAGLLARGADRSQAAVWAAWLHATAGDRLAVRRGRLGFLASELASEVPGLLDELARRPPTTRQ